MAVTSNLLQNDFRTSAGVGHKFIHSVQQIHEHAEFVAFATAKLRDPELVHGMYQTSTGDAHDWKFTAHKDTDAVPKPALCTQQNNIRSVDEKLRLSPWLPLVLKESEYSSQYVQKEAVTMLEKELAPAALSICKSRGLGRDEQPPVSPGPNSFAKHLDPYISTTHLSHTYFTDAQLYRNDIITMYTADVSSEISSRRQPVYDRMVFKKEDVVRVLPRVACTVPHKGMKTEMQAQYISES